MPLDFEQSHPSYTKVHQKPIWFSGILRDRPTCSGGIINESSLISRDNHESRSMTPLHLVVGELNAQIEDRKNSYRAKSQRTTIILCNQGTLHMDRSRKIPKSQRLKIKDWPAGIGASMASVARRSIINPQSSFFGGNYV